MRTLFETGILLSGVMLLAGAGATAHAVTGSTWATAGTMLVAAAAVATKGHEWAQVCWELILLGETDPYGAPTAHYKRTTRSRTLAPKLARLTRRATRKLQIVVVGTEPDCMARDRKRWDEALENAAMAGAEITVFVMPHDEAGKRRSEALAARHTNVECLIAERVPDVWCALQPVLAWSGKRDDPEKALLWVEGVPDDDDRTVDAEYRGTVNLRRNPGMLAEFHESTRAARAEATRSAATRKHH